MRKHSSSSSTDYGMVVLALLLGCLVNYLGDRLIGIRIELYYGLQTFNFLWFLQLFIVPMLAGIAVSMFYGFGGKWIAHFPPLIVRLVAYWETQYLTGVPDGTSLMPMGWWGFFVILAIECSAAGGVIGELLVKRTYGRHTPAPPLAQPDVSVGNGQDEGR